MSWAGDKEVCINKTASSNGKSRRSNMSEGSSKSPSPKHPRPVTVEKVKLIMEQEGRSARNLLSWNIPIEDSQKDRSKSGKRGAFPKYPGSGDSGSERNTPKKFGYVRSASGGKQKARDTITRPDTAALIDRKQVSFRARYWAYLFENLRRAVDEIYATCQSDSSVVECKEVLLILDNYRHEFQALIDWIQLEEKLENTDIRDRPTSLSWEVRKSSPGRPKQKRRGAEARNTGGNNTGAGGAAAPSQILQQQQRSKIYRNSYKNATKFNNKAQLEPPQPQPSSSVVHQQPPKSASMPSVATWADRVKGVVSTTNTSSPSIFNSSSPSSVTSQEKFKQETLEEEKEAFLEDDGGEWETVSSRSGRQSRNTNTPSSQQQLPSNNNRSQRSSFDSGHVQSRSSPDLKLSPNPSSLKPLLTTAGNEASVGGNKTVAPSSGNTKKKFQKKRVVKNQEMVEEAVDTTEAEYLASCKQQDSCVPDDVDNIDHMEKIADQNEEEEEVVASSSAEGGGTASDHQYSSLMKLEAREASLARTLHAQHDANIAVAEERERDLMRQIREAEAENTTASANVDAEDTDCDSARSSTGAKELPTVDENSNVKPMEWSEFLLMIKAEQQATAGVSWCDMIEQEENQLREPGSMVQMHEKLSSPSRKRTPAESRRKQEEKHRKAEARRLEIEKARTVRIKELTEKVGEVRNWKHDLIRRQREILQFSQSEKLERAKEQREQKLRKIVEKAQAEDTKVNEIAFINELQEKNKRHEVLMRIDEHEMRLQELDSEKTRMMEMKSAKEENVKERRRAIEKERQERIEELMVKRKEQDARIEQQRIEREKEREKLAKEKARERELRLSARNAAYMDSRSELQKKIQLKHDESERRHQEQLEIKKEKAVELTNVGRFSTVTTTTTPPNTPNLVVGKTESTSSIGSVVAGGGSNKVDFSTTISADSTTAAAAITTDDLSCSASQPGTAANDPSNSKQQKMENSSVITSQSWRKSMKKRTKKLRSRMSLRAKEFCKHLEANKLQQQNTTSSKSKIVRIVKDLNKILTNHKSGSSWLQNHLTSIDRFLNEIVRIFEKKTASDQNNFRIGGGFQVLEMIFNSVIATLNAKNSKFSNNNCFPDKSLVFAVQVFHLACVGSRDNQLYVLYSNRLTSLIDLLILLMTRNGEEERDEQNNNKKQQQSTTTSLLIVDAVSPLIFKTMGTLIEQFASISLPTPPANRNSRQKKSGSFSLVELISLMSSGDEKKTTESYVNRGLDVISYVVASGVFELLNEQLGQVRNLVRPGSNISSLVENGLWFLQVTTTFVAKRNRLLKTSMETNKNNQSGSGDEPRDRSSSAKAANQEAVADDPTYLLPILQHTELMGVVSVLYGLLLHGASARPTVLNSEPDKPQETIPVHTLCVARAVMRMLNAAAEMDLVLVQQNLGAKGIALEFRHICAYLLWYCSNTEMNCSLLHEVVVCIGHFALMNHDNQNVVNSGVQPTIIQQLGLLPFAYYSDPKLQLVLFPTLISCCYNNDSNFNTLEQDVSGSILATYIQSELNMKSKTGDGDSKKESQIKSSIMVRSLAESTQYTDEMLQNAVKYFSHQT